ncbi:uncharacterized protein LOC105838105 isoform X1 [Monomorium pharaonis]|uniref:uncharacterized protein LOC105838105 isoform X1 n=1 Tax=Monomorium pharaonis TaxID=307658 RepID=UPI001745F361|nr:uncharacterized protein LOC105838105 isoform X1 [Monomorium pharaonis]
MNIRYQFLLLIHMLCCAVTIHGILLDANDPETCNLLCVQCNATAVFADGRCECNFTDNNDEVSGTECIQSIQKEIQAIELNMLSDDLTDEERNVRSILKYRRRLRPGDAEKVAQYFINGGPAAGHSHFVRAFNAARDSDDSSSTNSFSGVVEESNPEDGFHSASLTSPVSWNTCDSPLYMVSESAPSYASPTMQGAEMYLPTHHSRTMNPAIAYPRGFYEPTGLLDSIVHPHGLPLHHPLLRAASLPAHVLHHILHPQRVYHHHPVYHHHVRNSRFPSDKSDTNIVSQPCENNGGSTTSSHLTAKNNADGPTEQNVHGSTAPSQIHPEPYVTRAQIPFYQSMEYQPVEYQNHPYQYTSYYSPFMNMLHPITNGYVLQLASPYGRDTSDPLITASNPYSFCENNANTEQKSGVSTADKTRFNNETEKSNSTTKNNIPQEKKSEKNETD